MKILIAMLDSANSSKCMEVIVKHIYSALAQEQQNPNRKQHPHYICCILEAFLMCCHNSDTDLSQLNNGQLKVVFKALINNMANFRKRAQVRRFLLGVNSALIKLADRIMQIVNVSDLGRHLAIHVEDAYFLRREKLEKFERMT
jgi:hypothetical protein